MNIKENSSIVLALKLDRTNSSIQVEKLHHNKFLQKEERSCSGITNTDFTGNASSQKKYASDNSYLL